MKTSFWLSASVVALTGASVTQAQAAPTTDPTTAATTNTASDEIVVTAERRATNLQRSGVAATVLTGEDLIKKGVNGVEQLQFATPSLTVNTSGQSNSFNIRGIGKSEIGSAVGVGVVTYRDGVATFPAYFQMEPYYDISNVEVLRGPQGTFAGGNATGGAVFITEANPTLGSVNGFVTGQYGNYNDAKIQAALNVPVSDTLALRFATDDERRDSFYHISGPYTGNPGNLRSYNGRISLLWQPTSQLRVLIKGDYSNVDAGGYPGSPATATTDPFHISSNAYLQGRDQSGRISANISYTLDDGIVLRSISGWQRARTEEHIDYDGTSLASQTFKDNVTERIWSQEINIVSPDDKPFTWLLGGYYQNDKYTFPAGGYLLTIPGVYSLGLVGTNPHTAAAGFGQVGYKLTDALQVTVGGRWSRSTSRNDAVYTIPQFGLNLAQHDFTADKKATGKVAVNWTIDPADFVYAFVATGHKAGGLNGLNLAFVPALPFKPENVTDYEIGWKRTWFDGHLKTQLGGYYNRYKNFQVTIIDPRTPAISSISNVTNPSTLYGGEFSAQGSFGALGIDATASVSHSSLGRFFAVDPRLPAGGTCNPATGPGTATCIDLKGQRQSYAPTFTLTAGVQYVIPIGGDKTLTPRADFSHISTTFGTLFENVALGDKLAPRNIVNVQLTFATGPWSIAGYADNLTNQHYIDSINALRRLAGNPRQFGVRASHTF